MTQESSLSRIGSALKTASFPFRVIAAVVFGSQVKGLASPSSDFDVLIVAEGINPRRQRRGEEIIAVTRALPWLQLDLLLLTREETVSNFENHNPLFLDIAEEGMIVLDAADFMKQLMAKTREYVREKGIKRLRDGWAFPVRPGVATPLSRVSNQDFAAAMLRDGERDLAIGKLLADEAFHDKAVYNFQQAVEKCLKAVLMTKGIFQKTHAVGQVLLRMLDNGEFPAKWQADLLEAATISAGMEPEINLSRYPGITEDRLWIPSEEYQQEDANRAYQGAYKVAATARRFVAEWFRPECPAIGPPP
jgi:HEPN domain-containing protein/predicted nucleotidyltransferase